MSRLPTPGSDDGAWGQILNDFLAQSHNTNGTLKSDAVSSSSLQDSSITKAKLATTNTATNGQLLASNGTGLSWVTGSGSVSLGGAASLALGTAAAGSAIAAAHEDHIHPTTGLTLATGGGVEGLSSINSANGATSLNLANGNVFNVTLTGDVSFSFTGATNNKACSFTLYISQDGSGNHNIIWPGGVLWPGGMIPTQTLAPNTVDIYIFESITGGSSWFGAQAGANYG